MRGRKKGVFLRIALFSPPFFSLVKDQLTCLSVHAKYLTDWKGAKRSLQEQYIFFKLGKYALLQTDTYIDKVWNGSMMPMPYLLL